MSTKSLADRIGSSVEEAESMKNNFYSGFSGVDKFTKASQEMLKEKGYVTDIYGRRRHLPDAQLPSFSITPAKKTSGTFNPMIGAVKHEDKLLEAKIKMYQEKLDKAKWQNERKVITAKAKAEGLNVRNNNLFISRAMRQCLNARIQGSSASVTKRAMGMIHNDTILKDLGFKLLVSVHDEVFGSAPKETAEEAAQRLAEVMVEAAKEKCGNVAWKCDPYVVAAWYSDEASANVKEGYDKLIKKGKQHDEAILETMEKYPMFTREGIEKVCSGEFNPSSKDDVNLLKGEA